MSCFSFAYLQTNSWICRNQLTHRQCVWPAEEEVLTHFTEVHGAIQQCTNTLLQVLRCSAEVLASEYLYLFISILFDYYFKELEQMSSSCRTTLYRTIYILLLHIHLIQQTTLVTAWATRITQTNTHSMLQPLCDSQADWMNNTITSGSIRSFIHMTNTHTASI